MQAVALAFREATYCSSGEDSDNSHSSRGSLGQTSSNGSTLAEDLNIIERTMVRRRGLVEDVSLLNCNL